MKFRTCVALLWAVLGLCNLAAQHGSLADVAATVDRETRARRALAFAWGQLDIASKAYQGDAAAEGRQALERIGAAVELAVTSLQSTGKHARRHPRHFKHAEIQTRKLLLDLKRLRSKLYLGDQGDFDRLIDQLEAANARLLRDLMGPRE